jgi:hypothetical protein
MANIDHSDMHKGLYQKYKISRTDGRDKPGEKHHGCAYFVLDMNHDPHARAALKAYADSCRSTRGELAEDLDRLVTRVDLFSPHEEAPAGSHRTINFADAE